jgi:squalene-hopene/tetraprenyl-beta-curcumene cyclase
MATRQIEVSQRVEQSLSLAADHLARLQSDDGSFDRGFDGGALPDAHFVVIDRILELGSGLVTDRLVRRLRDRQLADGSWELAPGAGGHLSTTVEAYVALRAAGLSASEPSLRRALGFIAAEGGVGSVRGPTRVTLAMLGLVAWTELNIPPAELALLPASAPISLFKVGAPLRLHLLPLLVLHALEAVPAPRLGRAIGAELKTTPVVGEDVPVARRGTIRARALDACLDMMRERLDADGTLGGLLMATGWAAAAARVAGLAPDDLLVQGPAKGLRSLVYRSEGRDVHARVCAPVVRSSAIALRALRAAGVGGDAVERGRDALVARRAGEHGDFEILGPRGPATAWSLTSGSRRFPSLADTASVVGAVAGLEGTGPLVESALRWIGTMQRHDGGFALFDRHAATAPWLARLPLGLLCHTLNDESSPEVTGRVLEIACRLGSLRPHRVQTAREYLERSQQGDGSWQGPFSLGLIPATTAALVGLAASGGSHTRAAERGVAFLLRSQHRDGGWGERPGTAARNGTNDLGRSLPTQTGFALEGLLAGGAPLRGGAVERAVWYLLWSQEPDGSWAEDDPASAGLADVVYLRDPVDAVARPMIALAAYLGRAHSR